MSLAGASVPWIRSMAKDLGLDKPKNSIDKGRGNA